jgi:hypothetical protein
MLAEGQSILYHFNFEKVADSSMLALAKICHIAKKIYFTQWPLGFFLLDSGILYLPFFLY